MYVFSIPGYRYPTHVIDSLNEPENHLYFGFKNNIADVIFSYHEDIKNNY